MSEQSYSNHRRFVTGFHVVLALVVLACVVVSLIHLYRSWGAGGSRLLAVLAVLLSVAAAQLYWYCRIFPLKAQDRAIRAEEKLRHYALTGEMPDPRLDTRQYIGLRFAGDEELPALAKRAAEEGLSENAIKKAVKDWRPDTYRV